MDQNFSLMAQSRANYYTAGSPVQFVRVELLKGDVTGEVAVCLTFKNVGTEPLTGFIIHFKCKDASGQILCEDDFYYEQLNVQPGELFGADDAVFVSDTPVSSAFRASRADATVLNAKMRTVSPMGKGLGFFSPSGRFSTLPDTIEICCAMIGMEVEITAMQTANVLMKFLMAYCSFYLKI